MLMAPQLFQCSFGTDVKAPRLAVFLLQSIATVLAGKQRNRRKPSALKKKVAETIKAKVQEVMASEATQQRIQRRLKEERASLEDKVALLPECRPHSTDTYTVYISFK